MTIHGAIIKRHICTSEWAVSNILPSKSPDVLSAPRFPPLPLLRLHAVLKINASHSKGPIHYGTVGKQRSEQKIDAFYIYYVYIVSISSAYNDSLCLPPPSSSPPFLLQQSMFYMHATPMTPYLTHDPLPHP